MKVNRSQSAKTWAAVSADAIAHGGHGDIIVKLDGHTHGFHDTHHALSMAKVRTVTFRSNRALRDTRVRVRRNMKQEP